MILNKTFILHRLSFTDKIVIKKRQEMVAIINDYIKKYKLKNVLDIGTTNDKIFKSSNYVLKNLKNLNNYKSISNQKIYDFTFKDTLLKSITSNLDKNIIKKFKSDLVLSVATIEHVGSFENQIKMIANIKKLTSKVLIISTPNRYHPMEFHTKLPLLHWLPKKYHRKILNILGLGFFSKESNLNLLSENDLKTILKKLNIKDYLIKKIMLFGFVSNFIIIARINR